MPLNYPKKFTDPDWKAAEKKIKVSATGIGKTLRELEAAVKVASADFDQKKDAVTVAKAILNIMPAIKKSDAAISAESSSARKAKNTAAEKYLDDLRHALGTYESELEHLAKGVDEAKSGYGWSVADNVQRFNERVKA